MGRRDHRHADDETGPGRETAGAALLNQVSGRAGSRLEGIVPQVAVLWRGISTWMAPD